MKPITKKVKQVIGAELKVEELLEFLAEVEFFFDYGQHTIASNDEIIIKVNGKVVDNNKVTISFKES